jgi:flagellar FliJ protein
MKKFKFSLETVLDYKQQVLDSLRTEHGAILAQLRAQEDAVRRLEEQYQELNADFCRRKMEGMTICEALGFEQYLRMEEHRIEKETQRLHEIQKQEEAKRSEVVDAKLETSSIEKLREKKLDGYHKAIQKAEELQIEEFVSTTRAMAAGVKA